jgi:hypothetical protein
MNRSSLACCCANSSLDISEILRRITPIEYYSGFLLPGEDACPSTKGTLLVDSNQFIYGQLAFPLCDGTGVGTTIDGNGISANNIIGTNLYANNSVYVGNTKITSNGPILQLPAGTTVGGLPIGASVQYFMMPLSPSSDQRTNLPSTSAGDYIVGGFFQNGYLSYVQFVYYWPCLFSANAIVTSLSIYANFAAAVPITGVSNFQAELMIRPQTGIVVPTGQIVTIDDGAIFNDNSVSSTVEGLSYSVTRGDRAGMLVSWTGNLADTDINNYTWITYNIGYIPIV